MKEAIKAQLKKLAHDREIRILLAIESGSRAWGFPSPDSDFDVRIIYAHKPAWYWSIDNHKDTFSYFEGKLLDFSGWELRKVLRLVKRSNMSPAEWMQSPIVYQEENGFRDKLAGLVAHYFSPYHTVNHYRGIAKNSFTSISNGGEKIKLKKLFYVIRPLLAARYVIHHKKVPPMNIFPLLDEINGNSMKNRIIELIALKETVDEGYFYEMETDVLHFIQNLIAEVDQLVLPKEKKEQDGEPLNAYFRELINVKFG